MRNIGAAGGEGFFAWCWWCCLISWYCFIILYSFEFFFISWYMCNVTFLSPGGTLPRYNVFCLSSLSSWCCCISPYSHVRSGFLASDAVAGVGDGAGADTFGREGFFAWCWWCCLISWYCFIILYSFEFFFISWYMCNVTFLSPGGTLPRYNVFCLSSLSSWCCCISPYSHVRSGFLASGDVAGVGDGNALSSSGTLSSSGSWMKSCTSSAKSVLALADGGGSFLDSHVGS